MDRRDVAAARRLDLLTDSLLPEKRERSKSCTNSEGLEWTAMVFTKRIREGIRRGRITCSVRIWTRPHVKAGGRYRMDEGQIVVDSIEPIDIADITNELARESGFNSVEDLLQIARHGPGDNVYLVRFHYLPPGVLIRRCGGIARRLVLGVTWRKFTFPSPLSGK